MFETHYQKAERRRDERAERSQQSAVWRGLCSYAAARKETVEMLCAHGRINAAVAMGRNHAAPYSDFHVMRDRMTLSATRLVSAMPLCPRCGARMVGGAPHGPWPVQYECARCGHIVIPSDGRDAARFADGEICP